MAAAVLCLRRLGNRRRDISVAGMGPFTYRLGNIPFFIPPGHVLLFWLGLVYAPHLSRFFVIAVPVAALGYAVYALEAGFDTFSIPLAGLFLLSWFHPDGRRLYSLMLVIALIFELYGTWSPLIDGNLSVMKRFVEIGEKQIITAV